MYDQTGSLEDSDDLAGERFDSLYKYYRALYRKVSVESCVVCYNNTLVLSCNIGNRHNRQKQEKFSVTQGNVQQMYHS